MATKRKISASPSQQRGSTMYGALAGLLFGLVIAAVVAFYVTKAQVPFVDRASRAPDRTEPLEPRPTRDPNMGLYGVDGAAGTPLNGPTVTPPIPLPGLPGTSSDPEKPLDELGALIATLPATNQRTPAPTPAKAPAPANGKYFLQAGAYQAAGDAESVKARILLLGLPVAVQRAEVNGKQINRVRVGPFARLDDMNRARGVLGENKIETAVVRQ